MHKRTQPLYLIYSRSAGDAAPDGLLRKVNLDPVFDLRGPSASDASVWLPLAGVDRGDSLGLSRGDLGGVGDVERGDRTPEFELGPERVRRSIALVLPEHNSKQMSDFETG